MSKDYSNTIIYKIFCKDTTIKDIYIGHTTNFEKRKYQHKLCSKSSFENKNNIKLYNFINQNGGWDNWDMIEIAKYNCKDFTEARIKELYHCNELCASLNTVPPYVDKTNYFCDECNIDCLCPKQLETHLFTNKHNKNIEKVTKNTNTKFNCENCDFICYKQSNWNRHLNTNKHNNTKQKYENNKRSICEFCNKIYSDRISLWRHKKTCKIIKKQNELVTIPITNEMIYEFMKQIISHQSNCA